MELSAIIEALLFAAQAPLGTARLAELVVAPEQRVSEVLQELVAHYATRGIELRERDGTYQFILHRDSAPWVAKLVRLEETVEVMEEPVAAAREFHGSPKTVASLAMPEGHLAHDEFEDPQLTRGAKKKVGNKKGSQEAGQSRPTLGSASDLGAPPPPPTKRDGAKAPALENAGALREAVDDAIARAASLLEQIKKES